MTHEANRSYRDVLRNRHVAGLLLGDLLASAGTGMLIVAMPVQTLSIHGSVPRAIAIGLVDAAVFAIVERLDEPKLATLDRRHFSLLRPRHRDSIDLLP